MAAIRMTTNSGAPRKAINTANTTPNLIMGHGPDSADALNQKSQRHDGKTNRQNHLAHPVGYDRKRDRHVFVFKQNKQIGVIRDDGADRGGNQVGE